MYDKDVPEVGLELHESGSEVVYWICIHKICSGHQGPLVHIRQRSSLFWMDGLGKDIPLGGCSLCLLSVNDPLAGAFEQCTECTVLHGRP